MKEYKNVYIDCVNFRLEDELNELSKKGWSIVDILLKRYSGDKGCEYLKDIHILMERESHANRNQ